MNKLQHAVFVYGTLQTNHVNHYVLHTGEHSFVGNGTTVPQFLLFDGKFPKMAALPRHAPAAVTELLGHVRGEVWRVDDEGLMACDRLEGHPHFYCREKIGVTLDGSNKTTSAWAYVIVNFPNYDRHALMKPKEGILEWNDSTRHKWSAGFAPVEKPLLRGRVLARDKKR